MVKAIVLLGYPHDRLFAMAEQDRVTADCEAGHGLVAEAALVLEPEHVPIELLCLLQIVNRNRPVSYTVKLSRIIRSIELYGFFVLLQCAQTENADAVPNGSLSRYQRLRASVKHAHGHLPNHLFYEISAQQSVKMQNIKKLVQPQVVTVTNNGKKKAAERLWA